VELGAIKLNDSRLTKESEDSESAPKSGAIRGAKVTVDDDDSDWE
jgi:hypothetical protein